MPLLSYGNTVNQKPSVLDAIILQGASKTPFLQWFSRGSVAAPKHSWILDRYRDAAENAQLEITDIDENTTSTKYMKDNVVQIVKNDFGVSYEEEQNAKYGQKEWPYRVAKEGKEHAKDLEYALLGLHHDSVYDPYVQGTPTTEAKMAGIFHYVPDEHKQHLDANGDGTGAATDFTYDHLHRILEPMWEKGGLEDESFMMVMGASLKQKVNLFAKDYIRLKNAEGNYDPTLYTITTDFGDVTVKIHRLFGNPKLRDKVLVGKLDEAAIMFKIATKFEEPPTSKTARFGRYYTSLTLEVKKDDYFACADGLK
ncbi:SU10 major capsid protein [Hydrogenimonas sp.]